MITRTFFAAALIVLGPLIDSSIAVITSDQPGSHVTTPGEPAFDINIDGVALIAAGAVDPEDVGYLAPVCTGVLISDRHILSAAHCYDANHDGAVDSEFVFPHVAVFELADGATRISVKSGEDGWGALPVNFPGEWPDIDADVAVIQLQRDAPAEVPRYPLYAGTDEVGRKFVLAGYGKPGYGPTGEDEAYGGPAVKRAGLNRYDVIRDDKPGVDFLAYDFDSGLEENNAHAIMGLESDLGFGVDEVHLGHGDSGGAGFIHGVIAGISSFGGRIVVADVDDMPNNSWGESGFGTRVSQFREFILQATDGTALFVPTGDFDHDSSLGASDIDLLSAQVYSGSYDEGFDLNLDKVLDEEDRRIWVEETFGTFFGDANLNKEVAFDDFLALSTAFGTAGGWEKGDFDGNGEIQFPDFLRLSVNFGKSAMDVLPAQVPEPSSLSLAVIAGLMSTLRPIRKCRFRGG